MKLGFKDLISPITLEDFHRNYWDVKFCHLAGQSDRFSHLLTWNALNLILAHTESLQHLHIVKDGKPIDQPSYVKNGVVAAAKLTGHLREGATLIFNRISEVHRPISDIAEEIGRALLCDVSVNLYAAWKTSHGFDVHWDDHDVIILQIHGDKHWQIYGVVENRFAQKGSAAANGFCQPPDPIWERTLRPGEVLYIPRGWWHFARPCDHAVAHLTVGLRPPFGDSFLRWMAKQATQRPELRRHVPLVSDELLEKYIAAMKEALTEMLADSELVRRSRSSWRSLPAASSGSRHTGSRRWRRRRWILAVWSRRGRRTRPDWSCLRLLRPEWHNGSRRTLGRVPGGCWCRSRAPG